MDEQKAKELLQSSTNSEAHILVAFLFAHKSLDIKEIAMWTGLSKKTISKALTGLETKKRLERRELGNGRVVWAPVERLP